MPSHRSRLCLFAILACLCACGAEQQPAGQVSQTPPDAAERKAPGPDAATGTQADTPRQKATQPGPPAKATEDPELEPTDGQDDPRLTYPRDKDKVVAKVAGANITLGEVIKHIDRLHYPGYAAFLSTKVGQLELRSPRISSFVRQYADYIVLKKESRARELKHSRILDKNAAAYEELFESYVENYKRRTRRQPPPPGPSRRSFVQEFQKHNGLGIEIRGLLRAMLPDEISQREADRFYREHANTFNGVIDVAQIFVRNRDQDTGALYTGERKAKIDARVKMIREKLDEDGSNFAEVAAQYSHSERSRATGGLLKNLRRMDARMPSSICRAAWKLREGQWTGPIESRFGLHFVKRLKWTMIAQILRFDATNADVQRFIMAHKEEDLLFSLREKYRLELLY